MSPRIERETTVDLGNRSSEIRRELIADLPDVTGVYETGAGIISIKMCEARLDQGLQKMVLRGEAVRTKDSLRRVVQFPIRSLKAYRGMVQTINPTERLIFTRSR